jgi:polysaccharide biosynthesis transport protein
MTHSQPPPSASSAAPAESSFSVAVFLRAVRKNWPITLVVFVVSALCAWLFTTNQRKLYQALAVVQLDPQALAPLGHSSAVESGVDGYWSNLEYFATQHQVITSRRVAELVVRKLGLNTDGAFLSNRLAGEESPSAKVTVEVAAEAVRAKLKVEPIEDSRLVRVKYTDADPERAQRVLAAVVDTYVDQNLDTGMDATNKTVEWLDTQLTRLKSDLESQEMELHDFKIKYNLLSVSYDDQTNMVRAQIQQLNTELTSLKTRKQAVEARLNALNSIDTQDPAEIPASELLAGGALGDLRSEYVRAKGAFALLRASGKGDNHPEMRALAAQVDAARGALLQELKNIQNGAQMDLVTVNRQVSGLSGLFKGAQQEALQLNLKELEYSRLHRSKENTEKLFSMVLERSTESGLSKMAPFNNVRVLDRPLKPRAPIYPNNSANLAVGMALGLLLGLGGAVGRDLLDRTVRTSEDTERELGLPLLGSLPNVSGENAGSSNGYYGRRGRKSQKGLPLPNSVAPELLVHTHPKSVVAEAARAIRTNLMFMSPDNPYRCLLVTSAGPSDGKTTVAAYIAIAIAQTGQSVCLVDCDLRKPRLHTLFKEKNDQGVTTALLDPGQLSSFLTETGIPNLSLLRAGPTPPNPADLMHSDAFARLLQELRTKFDRVVIDSPPIGLVTDGVILSTRVDATLLVVRALGTRRDAAKRAVRSLRDVGANCAGFVLNAVSSQEGYYYSGYYATYGATQPESPPAS